ncbi:MAG: KilA-N domain-containing protein [Cyanobacteria bacterium P01_E01_bin.6]
MSTLQTIDYNLKGKLIQQLVDNGYINLNQMAEATGKRVDNWLRLQETKDLISEFERQQNDLSELKSKNSSNKLPQIRGSLFELHQDQEYLEALVAIEGRGGGTWAHPDIAIQFAQWCSPVVALRVSQIVRNWYGIKRKVDSNKLETVTQLVDNLCAKYDNPCFQHDLAKLRIASAGNVLIADARQAVLNGDHVPVTFVNQESHFCNFAYDIDLIPSIGESVRLDVLWANLVQWYADKEVIKLSDGGSVVKLRKKILMIDDAPSVYRGGYLFDAKDKLLRWLNLNAFQFRAVMLDDETREWVSNGWTINNPLELNYDVIGWDLAS